MELTDGYLPGQRAAQDRLLDHWREGGLMSIRGAFDSLDLGFNFDTAREFIDAPGEPRAVLDRAGDDYSRLMGMFAAFAIQCVEADRERRGV